MFPTLLWDRYQRHENHLYVDFPGVGQAARGLRTWHGPRPAHTLTPSVHAGLLPRNREQEIRPAGGRTKMPMSKKKVILYIAIYMHENQSPSASKRLPYLGKACIMPWDVLEKKRTDHSYTSEVKSSSYSMLRQLFRSAYGKYQNVPTKKTITANTENLLLICFRLRRIGEIA